MPSLSTWPSEERPRERLRAKGPRALGDAELLAILLGTGSTAVNAIESARQLLSTTGGLERLAREGLGSLAVLPGIGPAKAARVVAAVELGVRVAERRTLNGRQCRFTCSADIYNTYRARLSLLQHEVFCAVALNNKNEPLRDFVVAQGSVNECQVSPREVFRPVLGEAAAKTVLLHNHPSGDPTPSPQDVALTRRLAQVGELIGIPVLDHIVIGHQSYASLRDLGLLIE